MATASPVSATPAHNLSSSARAEAAGLQSCTSATIQSQSPSYKVPSGDVTVPLNFFKPPEDGSIPFNYVEKQPAGQPQRNFGDQDIEVTIHDIRGEEDKYTLDKDAFKIISGIPESAEKDFTDSESIKKNYYPELEKLLLDNVPGANKVVFFDHTIRRADPDANRSPVTRVHIDQTPESALKRVYQHLPKDEAEKLAQGRYRIINVWRPLNGPVASYPLAYGSSYSIENEDLIPIEHRYPDRTGQTAGVQHDQNQRWNYLSGVRNDERILLECFDSEALKEGSTVQGGRVPHTAFVDPRTPEDAPGRESIEVRTLVFGQ